MRWEGPDSEAVFSFHLVSSPSGVSENVEYWAPTAESSVEVIVTVGGIVVVLEVKGGEREGGKGEGGKGEGGKGGEREGREGEGGEREGGKGERGREEVHTWSFLLKKLFMIIPWI